MLIYSRVYKLPEWYGNSPAPPPSAQENKGKMENKGIWPYFKFIKANLQHDFSMSAAI